MTEKIQNSFYLLKEEVNVFTKSSRKYIPQVVDLTHLKKIFKARKYKEQPLKNNLSQNYDVKLFYKRNTTPVKWKEFIATIANASADILKHQNGHSESYILLLFNKTTKQYFTSTGGYGHIDVQDVATNDLGIEILSRIVKAEDKALRSIKERSFTGGIQGSIKFFRNEYNFYDNESFGTVYNELRALLDKQKLVTLFGFSITDLRSDNLCIAKNSFSIKKSVSFKELLRIIQSCEKILKMSPVVEINSVVKIDRKNTSLVNSLDSDLDQLVFANYKKVAEFFSVEISHKEFEKYYQSEQTKLSFRVSRKLHEQFYDTPIREIQTILDEIRTVNSKLTKAELEIIMETGIIRTFDADGIILTEDTIRHHYCTEIKQGLKSYFLIEKDWYEISKTMIDKINVTCTNFVVEKKYIGPSMHKWDTTFSSENDFNASFIGKTDSLVFDKVTPSNIEVCDILRWDKNNIYLYHVKKGFNNSMRDLCGQVAIAARKVLEDKKSKFDFLGSLYDALYSNNGTSAYIIKAKAELGKITRADFINLFTDRKIIFVLAVLDTAVTTRTFEKNMADFDSNIAKFSLNELVQKMRNLEVHFQILQLTR
ncbi:DUF6119 family protein [Mucilaginibacter angelicae]|uniref:DUF6119 family protein n=1 Tax=Mucilaginibacter angelicae TaxID=869718 RepID=A0ABV6L5C6_9SPHI